MQKDVQKYVVNQYSIQSILTWVRDGDIAIPEIQRPFVWKKSKVRDLLDSLYQGYPIGYLITWRNPDIQLKDGTTSSGKRILIDGQQRVTALNSSILGQEVLTKDYRKTEIQISFHPIEERFEVTNSAILKDKTWIHDIKPITTGEARMTQVLKEYCELNPECDSNNIEDNLEKLKSIPNKQIGMIELNHELDIEIVTEIFIRINSQGVPLSQADFAMSKIASNEIYDGHNLRKGIDYFCHTAKEPSFHDLIRTNDPQFTNTEYYRAMKWLKDEYDDIYDPSYTDMLRVSFTKEFNRGKLADLVSLISGRNFAKRTYEEEIAKDSYERLKKSIFDYMNETHFKRFVMIIKSAGFIQSQLIKSQNALNFAYIIYLKLRKADTDSNLIEKFVRRWFVMSILTGRYSSSPESKFDRDVREINEKGIEETLGFIENSELSDAFWEFTVIQNLTTSISTNPTFNVYLAAQCKLNDRGFLSRDISVRQMIEHRGDRHHIFPKAYLKNFGFTRGRYNQIANYVYVQTEINIKIGKLPPNEYMQDVMIQCNGNEISYGAIDNLPDLYKNLEENCIPKEIFEMQIDQYDEFLRLRKRLMADKLKDYYYSL